MDALVSYRIIEVVIIVATISIFYLIKFLLSKASSLELLEKKVKRILDDEGISWKKEDGEMYIIKRGTRVDTYFRDSGRFNTARVFFVYRFQDGDLKDVHNIGQAVLANVVNGNNVCTTTIIKDNYLQSVYYADVKSAKEYVAEFHHAYDLFASVMKDVSELKPDIIKNFSQTESKNDEHQTIGFH